MLGATIVAAPVVAPAQADTRQDIRLCRNNACVELGYGVMWSSGLPQHDLLQGMTEVHERDVYFVAAKDLPIDGVEYRASKGDGTFMRYVG